MVSEANWMATHVMRNHDLGHKITLDRLKPRILNVFAYEFWGDSTGYTYIPYFALNPNNIEQKLPPAWKTQNYNSYNNYLQTDVLGSKNSAGGHRQGAFIYQIAKAKSDILEKSPGTMLYVTPQMQGEMKIDSASGYLVSIREPLNEEIEAQTMCALAHGAQGIIYPD
ncbi:MAG: hypothetical protein MUE56_08660 [Ignavibacteria bacterium]|jgi:hypothetical protein|nr:hypothetical protein [Ignavibacteria bacterium]